MESPKIEPHKISIIEIVEIVNIEVVGQELKIITLPMMMIITSSADCYEKGDDEWKESYQKSMALAAALVIEHAKLAG